LEVLVQCTDKNLKFCCSTVPVQILTLEGMLEEAGLLTALQNMNLIICLTRHKNIILLENMQSVYNIHRYL
jgi:hypothetical protein